MIKQSIGCPLSFLIGVLILTSGVAQAEPDATLDSTKNPAEQWATISDWNLGAFADNRVPNQVPNAPPLETSTLASLPPPTLEQASGTPALHFESGQALIGTMKDLPEEGGLGKGKPFAVRVTFVAQDQPEGSYGGLFQAMAYQHAGFRLMLQKDLRLYAEIYVGDGPGGVRVMRSGQPLQIGRSYTVEMRFEGSEATMLIDGTVDQTNSMAQPASYDGYFMIGRAAGPSYNFRGLINEVTILTPKKQSSDQP